MATIKELENKKRQAKEDYDKFINKAQEARERFHAAERDLNEARRKNCKHLKVLARTGSIFEPGRMSAPYNYTEYICAKCRKEVSKEYYDLMVERAITKNGGSYVI